MHQKMGMTNDLVIKDMLHIPGMSRMPRVGRKLTDKTWRDAPHASLKVRCNDTLLRSFLPVLPIGSLIHLHAFRQSTCPRQHRAGAVLLQRRIAASPSPLAGAGAISCTPPTRTSPVG
jgi:hypothetical protein